MTTSIHKLNQGYLVFTDHGAGPWRWLLRSGFRHCFVILASETHAVSFDPLLNRVELRVIEGPIAPLLAQLQRQGATILPVTVQPGRRRWQGADCVRLAKRLLGLSPWAAFSPAGLWRWGVFIKCSNNVLDKITPHP